MLDYCNSLLQAYRVSNKLTSLELGLRHVPFLKLLNITPVPNSFQWLKINK